MLHHFVGDFKGSVRPAEVFFEFFQVFHTEGRAVAFLRTRQRRAVPDHRLADDEGRALRVRLCLADGAAQQVEVVCVVHFQNLPALRLEAHGNVLFEGDVRASFDGDVVVIVEEDEFSQLLHSRKGAGLVGDPFFQASVAAQRVGVVVYDGEPFAVEGRGEMRFRKRHTHGVADALAERARGRLHAGRVAVFGVAGRLVAQLAEVHQIFLGNVVSEQIQKRIEEHGTVPCGQNKPVAVVPFGVLGIEFEKIRKDGVPDGCAAEGQAGVSGICLLDRLCREDADGVYRLFTNVHCFMISL